MEFLNAFFKNKNKVRTTDKKISIDENEKYKTLRFNGVVQSRIDNFSYLGGDYWDLFPPLCFAFKKPQMLMIGLGGGTIIKGINEIFKENINIEVVEINSEVIRIYNKFFNIKSDIKIINLDGFEYLQKKEKVYDIIILDAYDVDTIPEQFLTEKFVIAASSALRNNGILAINCISTMSLNDELQRYIDLIKKKLFVYSIIPGIVSSNKILLCSNKDIIRDKINIIIKELSKNKQNSAILAAYSRVIKE